MKTVSDIPVCWNWFHLIHLIHLVVFFFSEEQSMVGFNDNKKEYPTIWRKSRSLKSFSSPLNPIHYSRWAYYILGKEAPLPKICHTYPTMMKLRTVISYQKKIQYIYIYIYIYIYHMTYLVSSADISFFHQESAIFVISACTLENEVYC